VSVNHSPDSLHNSFASSYLAFPEMKLTTKTKQKLFTLVTWVASQQRLVLEVLSQTYLHTSRLIKGGGDPHP
jgi:hypothetical protein